MARGGGGGRGGGKLGALWEMCKWRVDIIHQPRPQGEKKREKKRDMSKFARSNKNCEKLEKSQFLLKLLDSSG